MSRNSDTGSHARRRAIVGCLAHLSATTHALLWMVSAGLVYSLLNALMRGLAQHIGPLQALAVVYATSLLAMAPMILRRPWRCYWPSNPVAMFARGAVHWLGMCLWFLAVGHITLAETTAIGFTGPLMVMLGAWMFLKESMRWERWVASGLGLVGVLVVISPRMSASTGPYSALMLVATAVFAGSFLMSKQLTRTEGPAVVVLWQSAIVTLLSAPLGLFGWTPLGSTQWLIVAACGLLLLTGNYCLTRAFSAADISASQPARFLDLAWASALGWLFFSERLEPSTVMGGLIILSSTLWIARREGDGRRRAPPF